ncbi:MAG: leucine-rich repeat domain-containing protein [Bacteroidota bacterium]|nr:leucine-rich repeat domain-containing protein [Bacteroidota bacterium]
MGIDDLYGRLIEAYCGKNLNNITAKIVELYKAEEYECIRTISNLVSEYLNIDTKNINKCFTKLIMTYHPDKEIYYKNEIDKHYQAGSNESLKKFTHIFLLEDIDKIVADSEFLEDDFESFEDEVWTYSHEDYNNDLYGIEDEEKDDDDYNYFKGDSSFYNALKKKIYSGSDIDFSSYQLEGIDEINLSEFGIENLDGVELCRHVMSLDISFNKLTDISELWCLKNLEELYLSDNQIEYIDVLSNLKNLHVLDLSNNLIEDLTPVLYLKNLDYVNIAGNRIPDYQIEELEKKGIVVNF